MSAFFIILLNGIIEGLTEFIPVSSTGHLIVLEHFLTFPGNNAETFQISIQIGAILAVCFYYRTLFMDLITSFKQQSYLVVNFIIVIMPTFICGFLFYDLIKTHLFSTTTVVAALIVGGIAMIVTDRYSTSSSQDNALSITEALGNISHKQALIVGCFQVLSL